jgi:hypothetical protein
MKLLKTAWKARALFARAAPRSGREGAGIHVVCGFSSVGKSEYMRHLITTPGAYYKMNPAYETMFMNKERRALRGGDMFHLDISNDTRTRDPHYRPDVNNHPLFAQGVLSAPITSIDILVLDVGTLRSRILGRPQTSDDLGRKGPRRAYDTARKIAVFDSCPIADRYAVWCDHFETTSAKIRYIYAGNRAYAEVADRQAAFDILNGQAAHFIPYVHQDR